MASSVSMQDRVVAQHHQSTKKKGLDVDNLIQAIDVEYKLAHWEQFEQSQQTSKSIAKANEIRNLGNKKFNLAQDEEALELYTKSISFAVDGSEELALAYANRSAVLIRIHEYVPCLLDVNRALAGKYPEHLRQKLLDRKERCLDQIVVASKNEQKPHTIKGDETDPTNAENLVDADNNWRSVCNFKNLLIPNASHKIKITCDEQWGRHVVAVEDIEPGEILSSQEFFISWLMAGIPYKYCSFCFSRCYALIPCPSCTDMMYCSRRCLNRADEAYHRTECKLFVSRKVELDLVTFPATRALLVGTEQGARLENLMEKLTIRDIFEEKIDPTNEPFVNDYLSVLKLCRTFDPSLLKLSVSFAVDIIAALRRGGFFKTDTNGLPELRQGSLSKAELFATMLWLNHMVSLKSGYSFSFTEVDSPREWPPSAKSEIGRGVCTFHSLINHSCDPNTQWLVRNREHILFAGRPIKKNEQIFTSYFNTFTDNPKTTRIQMLDDQYEFCCKCEACVNNWPVFDDLVKLKTKFLIKNENEVNMYVNQHILPVINKGTAEVSNREMLEMVCNLSKWLHINVKKPSAVFRRCSDLMNMLMALSYTLPKEDMTVFQNKKIMETFLLLIVQDMLVQVLI